MCIRDRLKDGLGIGVAGKANRALAAAAQADRVTYGFQMTNENGDLVRDYVVTRVGDDYLIAVTLHAAPGEPAQSGRQIWILDGRYYVDFDGRVTETTAEALASFLEPALPQAVFALPDEFTEASWRAFERGDRFTATGTAPSQAQVILVMDGETWRISDLTLGRSGRGVHAEVRVAGLTAAELDRAALESSLNQAIIIGDTDRSNAAMQDYVQAEGFFVVRYPRTWRAGTWHSEQRRVEFSTSCGAEEGCPGLVASLYDLEEGKGPRQYAEDLDRSLGMQVQYREVSAGTIVLGDEMVGVVEYLLDRVVHGDVETSRHVEYVFEGELWRYHLDFSAPEQQFEDHQALFEEMAGSFAYLKGERQPRVAPGARQDQHPGVPAAA